MGQRTRGGCRLRLGPRWEPTANSRERASGFHVAFLGREGKKRGRGSFSRHQPCGTFPRPTRTTPSRKNDPRPLFFPPFSFPEENTIRVPFSFPPDAVTFVFILTTVRRKSGRVSYV